MRVMLGLLEQTMQTGVTELLGPGFLGLRQNLEIVTKLLDRGTDSSSEPLAFSELGLLCCKGLS